MTRPAHAAGQAGMAPGAVKIRLSGEAGDVGALAAVLAAAGVEVIDRSGPRANRYDPGQRVYLTVRITGGTRMDEPRWP